jgi:hypothetical protein
LADFRRRVSHVTFCDTSENPLPRVSFINLNDPQKARYMHMKIKQSTNKSKELCKNQFEMIKKNSRSKPKNFHLRSANILLWDHVNMEHILPCRNICSRKLCAKPYRGQGWSSFSSCGCCSPSGRKSRLASSPNRTTSYQVNKIKRKYSRTGL